MALPSLASPAQAGLTAEQRERGMRLAMLGQFVGVHLELLIASSAICPLFIIKLGGSDLQAMLPAGLSGLMVLVQIFAAVLIKPKHGKQFMLWCWNLGAWSVGAALVVVLLLGTGPLTTWLVLTFFCLNQFFAYLGTIFWFPLLHDIIPARQRGRYFGKMRAIFGIIFFGLNVLSGIFLGSNPALWKFVVVFGLAAGLQIGRHLLQRQLPLRPQTVPLANSWREDIAYIFKSKPVMILCCYFTLLMFLAGFLTQPLVLYMKHLGFSVRDNTLIYAAATVGSVLALITVGKLVDRVSSRQVFFGIQLILSLLALLVAIVGLVPAGLAKPCLVGILVVSGATIAAGNLASTAQIFHVAPSGAKQMFMSIMHIWVLGYYLAPLLAGLILDSSWRAFSIQLGNMTVGIYQMLFLGTGLLLLLALRLLPFIPNVRVTSPTDGAPEII